MPVPLALRPSCTPLLAAAKLTALLPERFTTPLPLSPTHRPLSPVPLTLKTAVPLRLMMPLLLPPAPLVIGPADWVYVPADWLNTPVEVPRPSARNPPTVVVPPVWVNAP